MSDSSFAKKQAKEEILQALFDQRKKWFIHALSSAIENISTDDFVNQMFEDSSSSAYVPDRICEIILQSISDDREAYISQLLNYLSENCNFYEIEEIQRVGSQLLNLSTKQIQIELSHRQKIKELSNNNTNLKKQMAKTNKKQTEFIIAKLIHLNTDLYSLAQEVRTFQRKIPIIIEKQKKKVNEILTESSFKATQKVRNLERENRILAIQNSKLEDINSNENLQMQREEITKLKDVLHHMRKKCRKLEFENTQKQNLSDSLALQLEDAKNISRNAQTQLSKIRAETSISNSIQLQTSTENESLKVELELLKDKYKQKKLKIRKLKENLKNVEEIAIKKFEHLIISQKSVKKLKDEFEKVSFVLNELNSIDTNSDPIDAIREQLEELKTKILSKRFQFDQLDGLKQKCEKLLLTHDQIQDAFSDKEFKDLLPLVEMLTHFQLSEDLISTLKDLKGKLEVAQIKSETDETFSKVFLQMDKKSEEIRKLQNKNLRLQNENAELTDELDTIKKQLQNESTRLFISPKKQSNSTDSEKTITTSEINNPPFEEKESPIFHHKRSSTSESDDTNEINRNSFYRLLRRKKSDFHSPEDLSMVQTLSTLFDIENANDIPFKISELMDKSEEFDNFRTTLRSSLNINNQNDEVDNEIVIEIQKLRFENKKLKVREEKLNTIFQGKIPLSQIPIEVAKLVKNQQLFIDTLRSENIESIVELVEDYNTLKKLNKAFVEREELFRNSLPKYEFEKVPLFLSAIIKENNGFNAIKQELEKQNISITVYQIPAFIINLRKSFVGFMEKFCKLTLINQSNSNQTPNDDLINSIAKIDEIKLLLPADEVIDIRGFVKRVL